MSEPNAGTDVLGMRSNAVYDSARDGYILNGTKVSAHGNLSVFLWIIRYFKSQYDLKKSTLHMRPLNCDNRIDVDYQWDMYGFRKTDRYYSIYC